MEVLNQLCGLVGVTAFLNIMSLSLVKEKSSRFVKERVWPFRGSDQNKIVEPSATLTLVIDLYTSTGLTKSLHQKEPLIFFH